MRNLGLSDLVRGPDIEQMAIFFGVVGTVADRKHIADREADEVDRYRDLPPLRLVKQCARPEIADPALAQLGGGIGTRGPGETQLETDRRKIQRRIDQLKSDLEAVRRVRRQQSGGCRAGC